MLEVTWIIILTIGILYLARLGSYLIGWSKIDPYNKKRAPNNIRLSIIIPVRNESGNIENLINDLSDQNYMEDNYEVIIINDHSEDQTVDKIKSVLPGKNINLVNLGEGETGKRIAIKKGLETANNKIIIMTDGDCRVDQGWIRDMAGYFYDASARLVFGPVFHKANRRILFSMQNLESASLIAAGAGSAGIGSPILCNAANMAFYKEDYLQFLEEQKHFHVSGDDVFFLHWMKKKYPEGIHYNKSPHSVVITEPLSNLNDFISQRMRWTSKSRYYRDIHIMSSAVLIYLINFFLFMLIIMSFTSRVYIIPFVVLFSLKSIADVILLFPFLCYYRRGYLLLYFLPAQIIYFFYVSFVGLAGNITSFNWKGRKFDGTKDYG